eukprot:Skav214785  [mRNA]  locus=scaffold1820:35141:42466:+ [translate_table: standard]
MSAPPARGRGREGSLDRRSRGSEGPLFSQEQMRQLESIHAQAPWIYSRLERELPEPARPSFLDRDEERMRIEKERMEELELRRMEEEEERKQMRFLMEQIVHENQILREQVKTLEARKKADEEKFDTPEEAPPKEAARPPAAEGGARKLTFEEAETPKEPTERRGREETKKPEGGRQEESRSRSRPSEGPGGGGTGADAKSMEFMFLMVESMRELAKKVQAPRESESVIQGVEVVRTGIPEFPALPVWNPLSGPLQLGDWLLMIEPLIADMTPSSESWWELMVSEAEKWYQLHITLNPLDRVQHDFQPPPQLVQKKWQRLERRVSSMILQALPQSLREELVSSRRIGTFPILTQLFLTYCPGGVAEKQMLLRQLEDPPEAPSLAEAPAAIRTWIRWKKRSNEVGAVTPDPALLLKGLNKLTRRVLDGHRDLQFRVSLLRSGLAVDTSPTESTVDMLATHLLAEIEQVALMERKPNPSNPGPKTDPKIRAMDADPAKGKGKGKDGGQEDEERPKRCKFFWTEAGCRKGKSCTWSHEGKDDVRRCYVCGATDHLAPACTRPRSVSPTKEGGRQRQKGLRREEDPRRSPKSEADSSNTSEAGGSPMKELLEEASKMLRSLESAPGGTSSSSSEAAKEEDEKGDIMKRLQEQLKSFSVNSASSLKVFRLMRIRTEGDQGLLDSGATHPMRPMMRSEEGKKFEEVEVGLADGQVIRMKMTEGGVMLSPMSHVEPIVPMGWLACRLGCEIRWKGKDIEVIHPTRGRLPVVQVEGCPQIPRNLAIDLIKEMEEDRMDTENTSDEFSQEVSWMMKLIEVHPVLKDLPSWIKDRLCVTPGDWSDLPANKRTRKVMRRDGFGVHLFAGEEDGKHLGKVWTSMGGDARNLLEVDILRGERHDLMKDKGVYSALLRCALEGKLKAIVGGHNCRSRSVLRHRPISGVPDAPRPIRSWGGGEYGIEGLTVEETRIIYEDDILLWRMWFLFIVAHHVGKARGVPQNVVISMEHPASPREYQPEVVSWWDTKEWKKLKSFYDLFECTFNQGAFGGTAVKPTTFGGSLEIEVEDFQQPMKQLLRRKGLRTSKPLARWAPGVMRMVSAALMEVIHRRRPKLKVITWEEHLMFNHTPFRRDCRVCQESLQQVEPHRKVAHPHAAVLSIDVSGPMIPAYDQGGYQARWMLAGALTWRVPKGTEKLKVPPDEEIERDAPMIEVAGEEDDQEEEGREDPPPEEDEPPPGGRDPPEDEEKRPDEECSRPGDVEDTELRVFRLGLPMRTKTCREVTQTTLEMVLRLRMDGYHVNQIHSDLGHEFGTEFRNWAKSRGIWVTRTSGEDPQGNGRAEQTIKALKNQTRRALRQAHVGSKWWPWALRFVNEVNRCYRLGTSPTWPEFLAEVRTRKRARGRGAFDMGVEKVQYLCPAPEDHGHWVVKEGEGEVPRVTKMILRRTMEPINDHVWIGVQEEARGAFEARREVRRRPAVRKMKLFPEDPEEKMKEEEEDFRRRSEAMLAEETMRLVEDSFDLAQWELGFLARIRKMVTQREEEEELLQTKIVSPKEVSKNWEVWKPAIDAEVQSMLHEKLAFEVIDEKEEARLKKEAESRGRKIQYIPSSLVFTRKPGENGGKRKARWVVCGNYEAKSPDENNFSSGADAVAYRILIWTASRMKWRTVMIDVKAAFLNAEMVQAPEEDVILVLPPFLFKEKKYMGEGKKFRPIKAVYGFRRSPKLWGDERDSVLRRMEVWMKKGGKDVRMRLRQMEAEPNLWKIVVEDEVEDEEETSEEVLMGLLMTYVDDMVVTGSEEVTWAVVQKIQTTWKSSPPEEVLEKPVKFLGMDVQREVDENGEEVLLLSQRSYIRDLLDRSEERKPRVVPISRDQSLMSPDPKAPTLEQVRECQRMVGEVLWLVTRTRPDLMFACSRMGSQLMKAAMTVKETYEQTLGYLTKTSSDGLRFKDTEQEISIQMFSDASFAPEGSCSHGCFMVFINGNMVFWRSGRQASITLSTAEAELMEIIEGMTAAESVSCIVEELFGPVRKQAYTDSQAAQAILTSEGGHWRTRHLRLRALFARQSIQRGDWCIEHTPGESQVADLGTKALNAVRMTHLKKMIGMKCDGSPEDEKEDEEDAQAEVEVEREEMMRETKAFFEERRKNDGMEKRQKAEAILKLITLAALVEGANAQDEVEEEGGSNLLWAMMMVYTLVVILTTLLVQKLWKVGVSWMNPDRKSPVADDLKKGKDLKEDDETPNQEAVQTPIEEKKEDENSFPNSFQAMTPEEKEKWIEAENAFLGIDGDIDFRGGEEMEEERLTHRGQGEVQRRLRIFKTKWGSVFHLSRDCPYLSGTSAGASYESEWCSLCEEKWKSEKKGEVKKVMVEGLRGPFHTDRCRRLKTCESQTTHWLPICSRCQGK